MEVAGYEVDRDALTVPGTDPPHKAGHSEVSQLRAQPPGHELVKAAITGFVYSVYSVYIMCTLTWCQCR